MDTRRQSTTVAQAFGARRRHSRRGHFMRTSVQSAERPYAPSREALTFKASEVSVSVGEA